jgi:hypothetical protein
MYDGTFIVLTHPDWNFSQPHHAGPCIVQGYCRGFEQIGIPALTIPDTRAEYEIPQEENPIIMVGTDSFNRLSEAGRREISKHPHFIWVGLWCDGIEKLAEQCGSQNPVTHEHIRKYIFDSGADFVFCTSPKAYFNYYENWIKHGQKLVSLLEACDTERYFPEPNDSRFSDVQMALVNGYNNRKDSRYQQYLWPYEDKLKIWGYNQWPRCYQGVLPIDSERVLYQNARVCPAVGALFAEITGSFYERPFKILGSGGLVIPGVMPGYREVFNLDELLVPATLDEYHDMIMLALNDEDFNSYYRETGRKAVLERHTYAHRARQILEAL